MKQLAFGLVCAAAVATMTFPAAAQVGVRIGEDGVGVRVGRDRAEYREREYRERNHYREHHYARECNTFWRDGHRVKVCRDNY